MAMLGKLGIMKAHLEKIETPQVGLASASLFADGAKDPIGAVRAQLVDLIRQVENECTKDLPHSQQPAGCKRLRVL